MIERVRSWGSRGTPWLMNWVTFGLEAMVLGLVLGILYAVMPSDEPERTPILVFGSLVMGVAWIRRIFRCSHHNEGTGVAGRRPVTRDLSKQGASHTRAGPRVHPSGAPRAT